MMKKVKFENWLHYLNANRITVEFITLTKTKKESKVCLTYL